MRYSLKPARRVFRSPLAGGLVFIAVVLALTTIITLATHAWISCTSSSASPPTVIASKALDEYSFVDNDYPQYHPVDLADVSLAPENTIHYQIYTEDAPREWASIFPPGGGFVHLGPLRRPFGLALFHQLHCLARIRRAMAERQTSEHVHHCFNYLRQAILCEANPTIEPVIPILGRRSVNGEIPRTCRDWTAVYALAAVDFNATRVALGGRDGEDEEEGGLRYV